MPFSNGKRPIKIVTACMTKEGTPTFALNQMEVTQEEAENGIHYYLAEANLLQDGYEEPYVHFSEDEAPPFLHPAVRQSIAQNANTLEECACPASSN